MVRQKQNYPPNIISYIRRFACSYAPAKRKETRLHIVHSDFSEMTLMRYFLAIRAIY